MKKPLAIAATIAILPALVMIGLLVDPGENSLFEGIPDELVRDVTLRRAEDSVVPSLSQEQAIANASGGVALAPGAAAPVREAILLWLNEDDRVSPPKERLVWGVNFSEPDAIDVDPGIPGCSVERKAIYVIVLVDAVTGERVMTMEGYPPVDPAVCPDALGPDPQDATAP